MPEYHAPFPYQLPSSRSGYVGPSSEMFQVLREAQLVLGGGYGVKNFRENYIAWLLAQRRAAEESRARKRQEREARWREVAAGERRALSVEQACVLWSDKASEQSSAGKAVAARYDRLSAAIEKVAA